MIHFQATVALFQEQAHPADRWALQKLNASDRRQPTNIRRSLQNV